MIELPALPSDDRQRVIWVADWVELELLCGTSTSVSLIEVADVLRDDPSDDVGSATGDQGDIGRAAWETAELLAEAALSELRDRAAWLQDRYPLTISSEFVSLRDGSVTLPIYRFLALVRARHLYSRVRALPDPGQEFEELVNYAVGAYVGGQVVRFGPGKTGARGDGLPPVLWDAVVDLAQRMHESVNSITDAGHGDYKVDVIAWKPFGDERAGQIVVLCQSTVSENEWITKLPAKRWMERRLVHFLANPIEAVAFSETLSLTSKEELRGGNFHAIPLDRLRILGMVDASTVPESLKKRLDDWCAVAREEIPK